MKTRSKKKIKLDFMVYKLEEVAYVPNPILIKIIKPDNIFITGILGKSGIKLIEKGVCFLFTEKLGRELIKMEVAIEIRKVVSKEDLLKPFSEFEKEHNIKGVRNDMGEIK